MYISNRFTAESAEPWLQLVSAIIILGTAVWMFCRTWRGEKDWLAARQESERHHHDESKLIDTGHGTVELSILNKVSRRTGAYARSAVKSGMPVLFR